MPLLAIKNEISWVNAFLQIDLQAVARNYQKLKTRVSWSSRCGAVVKSNAYGLGAIPIVNILYKKGCYDFFVMDLEEGLALKKKLPNDKKIKIYLLRGICPSQEDEIVNNELVPVISTKQQLILWNQTSILYGKSLDTVISIDSGMNREGLEYNFGQEFLINLGQYKGLNILFWQSHLSSAYNPESVANQEQLEKVKILKSLAPHLDISLCNSGGIFLSEDFHFQLCRPGMALYGLNPLKNQANPLELSVELFARVVQVRSVKKGEEVGYDTTFKVERDTKIATIAIGYADGVPWQLGNYGYVMFNDFKASIIGRVSMNFITVDVSDIPEDLVYEGVLAQILGSQVTPEIIANLSQTTAYEILTNLGATSSKIYV